MSRSIIFRADAGPETGLGHVMRSSSLMQMLQGDFECTFLTNAPEYFPYADFREKPDVLQFGENGHDEAVKLNAFISRPSIVVLDGYQFTTRYQQDLKNAGHIVICIDDIVGYHFVADAVINHAGGVTASDYSAEPYTKFYLGPAFSLVKPLFNIAVSKPLDKKVLLVCLGGADPSNETAKIIGSVSGFEKVHVILGAANKHAEKIKTLYAGHGVVHIHHNISSEQMFELMKGSPYAVLSPSTICYEYMFTGGVVFLCQIADNQKRIKKYFIEEGLAFDYMDMAEISREQMQRSILIQEKVFDKKNISRLKNIFTGLPSEICG